MSEHFTRNTVSAAFFCPKCGKQTQHRIDHDRTGAGRKGPCLECSARADMEWEARRQQKSDAERQGSLFHV
jgi:predicted RNA-binding Zn-ribbon protein involved in translation (DUF1610 family)